jgi:hypothetical protein
MRNLALCAAAAAGLLLATTAGATEFVQNGGFETGDLTDWTKVGNFTGFNGVIPVAAHTGGFGLADGNFPSQGLAGVSQVLSTTAGQDYEISLWWRTTGANDGDNQLYQVMWDTIVVGQIQGSAASNTFTNLTYNVVGAGNDTLTVVGFSTSGHNFTDDISVTDMAVTGGVPEPATWAMLIAGFGGIGAMMRRRRASPSCA